MPRCCRVANMKHNYWFRQPEKCANTVEFRNRHSVHKVSVDVLIHNSQHICQILIELNRDLCWLLWNSRQHFIRSSVACEQRVAKAVGVSSVNFPCENEWDELWFGRWHSIGSAGIRAFFRRRRYKRSKRWQHRIRSTPTRDNHIDWTEFRIE